MAGRSDSSVKLQEKKCEICSRSFARSEHLSRHMRTHTKEKPFACPFCNKAFQRDDVKGIHIKKFHASVTEDAEGSSQIDEPPRKRVRVACDPCRRRKTRCDGAYPCAPCQTTSSACHYTTDPTPSETSSLRQSGLDLEPPPDESFRQNFGTIDNSGELMIDLVSSTDQGSGNLPPSSLTAGLASSSWTNRASCTAQGNVQTLSESFEPGITEISSHQGMPTAVSEYGLDDSWAMTAINSQFWFDGQEFTWAEDVYFNNEPPQNQSYESSVPSLIAMIEEYFDSRSRGSSPGPNKATANWYSTPPDLAHHDKDIVRVFIGLFQSHIPETFPLFRSRLDDQHTTSVYGLAMAAVGGLFCPISGSSQIAKLLYNDARRLLLAKVRNGDPGSNVTSTTMLFEIKTFILLELYGLCGGDKRSYEFVEVFRGDMMTSAQKYLTACRERTTDSEVDDNFNLFESLHILDCYRVIIMQRPPTISPFYSESYKKSSSDDLTSKFTGILRGLLSSAHVAKGSKNARFDNAAISVLSTYAWPAFYDRVNRHGSENFSIEGLSLRSAGFIELSCDGWLQCCASVERPYPLVTYHLVHILLHANVTVLQAYAHSGAGSLTRDPSKSAIAKELQGWAQGNDHMVASWHAQRLVAVIEDVLATSSHQSSLTNTCENTQISGVLAGQTFLQYEAPHVPYAVYYAALVLYCGATIRNNSTQISNDAISSLSRAKRILSAHKVHIAQLLARVLDKITQ